MWFVKVSIVRSCVCVRLQYPPIALHPPPYPPILCWFWTQLSCVLYPPLARITVFLLCLGFATFMFLWISDTNIIQVCCKVTPSISYLAILWPLPIFLSASHFFPYIPTDKTKPCPNCRETIDCFCCCLFVSLFLPLFVYFSRFPHRHASKLTSTTKPPLCLHYGSPPKDYPLLWIASPPN